MLINIPSLLRIKPKAIDRLGKYLANNKFENICLFWGEGLQAVFGDKVTAALHEYKINLRQTRDITSDELKEIFELYLQIPHSAQAILAIGGGKAIDVAKYLAHISKLPLIVVPTAVSNDSFCSSLSSLKNAGAKRTLPTILPYGVVIDTEIISEAPLPFFFAGVGDLICKYTAIFDWKLAFHRTGLAVNDFAVSVAYSAVDNFLNYPNKNRQDLEFIRAFASSLMLSGISMEIAGSSRPASGSEHLISHAYDSLAEKPSMHGLQVGVAAYAVSWLQQKTHERVKAGVLESGFVQFMSANRLNKKSFIEAIEKAPSIKENFYSVLSEPGAIPNLIQFVESDQLANEMLA